jgi:hypothetical protein
MSSGSSTGYSITASSLALSALDYRGQLPATDGSFWDTLRFSNWLQNGQPTGAEGNSTTAMGTYTLTVSRTTLTKSRGECPLRMAATSCPRPSELPPSGGQIFEGRSCAGAFPQRRLRGFGWFPDLPGPIPAQGSLADEALSYSSTLIVLASHSRSTTMLRGRLGHPGRPCRTGRRRGSGHRE